MSSFGGPRSIDQEKEGSAEGEGGERGEREAAQGSGTTPNP